MGCFKTALLVTVASLLCKPAFSSPLLVELASLSLSLDLSDDLPAPALEKFQTSHVSLAVAASADLETRVTPDYLYTLMCTEAGFRGECEVFGAHPGKCIGFYSFNDTSLVETYDNNVSSISTNTGGLCQFYLLPGCDENGDDPGHSMAYAYDLAENGTTGYVGVFDLGGYDNKISSWRC